MKRLFALLVPLLLIAGAADARPRHYRTVTYDVGAGVIGSRPAGCPSRYCGCEASLYLFGRIIPSLNLAANWLRFPPAMPAPRMVAARRGHVFVLLSHVEGDNWLVHDGNSGGQRTREHVRSLRGYRVVNPGGGGGMLFAGL